jgi:ubiquinol-cytochrome c reductase iron-sulfur subunit
VSGTLDRRTFATLAAAAGLSPKRALAADAGEPVPAYWDDPIDISLLARGDWLTALIDGDPVCLRRRTAAEIAAARATPLADLPDPATDESRVTGDGEWLVVSGVCTHAGCQAQTGLGPYRGWECFCHGSVYDTSGRVRQGPAKRNLPVIPHRFSGAAIVLTQPPSLRSSA